MPWTFNPFTANFDYYQAGGGAVAPDGPFDFMNGNDIEFMDGNAIDFMST